MEISSSRLILVTGPARSGKSEWAEILANQSGKSVIYVATAMVDPTDVEWCDRIQQHQTRRPSEWKTLEVPMELGAALDQNANLNVCILVDSLGTWVANLLDLDQNLWENRLESLLSSLTQIKGDVIFVAEETGWGVIPAYPMGRTFRDRLGTLVRRIGAIANPVYLVTGGHVLNLSQWGSPLP